MTWLVTALPRFYISALGRRKNEEVNGVVVDTTPKSGSRINTNLKS